MVTKYIMFYKLRINFGLLIRISLKNLDKFLNNFYILYIFFEFYLNS